jgi:acetyltransferase
VVQEREVTKEQLPKLPIRPYPLQYTESWKLKDGTPVLIRPIRPEDEPLMVKFHESLSERSVYLRYLPMMKLSQRVAHERLTRMCFIDYDREIALVAEHKDEKTGQLQILGVGRLRKLQGADDGEFAVVISDEYQGRGLGMELVRRVIDMGREEKLKRIVGDVLPDNVNMLRVCEKLGFTVKGEMDDPVLRTEINL